MSKSIITPLKRIRFLSGTRACECAAVLGKSRSTYSLMENGYRTFRVDDALTLAKFLDVPVEKLFAKGHGGEKG
jgi:transcriptional regulator with XRE-family HTH domain